MANSDDYDLDKLSGMSPVAYDFGVASETRSAASGGHGQLRVTRVLRASKGITQNFSRPTGPSS